MLCSVTNMQNKIRKKLFHVFQTLHTHVEPDMDMYLHISKLAYISSKAKMYTLQL